MELDDAAVVPRPRRGIALVAAVVIAALLVPFVVVLATRDPATDRRTQSPLVGRAAPPIITTTLDGEAFDLDARRGQWVVVNFFATWCTPCRVEHPELVAFSESHADVGDASVVSVVFDDQPENVAAFFAEEGGSWPVVDGSGVILDWAVAQVPESFIVAPNGVVAAKVIGGVTEAGLDGLIAELSAAVDDGAGSG
jgi:cytochrome c biogenesis protein CcmG/thiol:disulfide interchange protein DsbE